jgi:1,4-dihydroxy-6-naphthoate synthase
MRLRIAFTPDPDDAFFLWALLHGRIEIDGCEIEWTARPIDEINRATRAGDYDLASISSVFYPSIASSHAILRSGSSVGRGYGPALVTREGDRRELAGETIVVAGDTTTGAGLVQAFIPRVRTRVCPLDRIRHEVGSGASIAGVLVHEELLDTTAPRLERRLCLGAEWTRRTGLPLPVGLFVARRELGSALLARIAEAVFRSTLHALENRVEAFAWASRFGVQRGVAVADRFIRMFANEDTLWMPEDVEAALPVLFEAMTAVIPDSAPPRVEIIDPGSTAARIAADRIAGRSKESRLVESRT